MHRFLAATFILTTCVVLGRNDAYADRPGCVNSLSGGSITCGGDITSPAPAPSGQPTSYGAGGSAGDSDKVYRPVDTPTTGPSGEPCIATTFVEVPPGSPALPANNGRDTGNVLSNPPPCPAVEGAPAETPAQVAARYWEEVPLPTPQPAIAPGWAISGKLAYLETRGETTHTYYNDTPLGRLQIVATGIYEVDWGDGSPIETHHIEGKPWPDGAITHDYQWVGTYDVVVTENWSATWHLGGESGNLRRLRTEGRIDDFEVRQIQAVRYR